jgi:glycosyltransferase involved in cell wall biosynthesis
MCDHHPGHTFVFFTDEPLALGLPQNASLKVIGKPVKGCFSLRRWMESSLRKAMKEHQIEVLLSLDGCAVLSTTTPQVIGLTDIKLIDRHKGLTSFFFHRYYKQSFQKASFIVTVSEAVKKAVTRRFLIAGKHIHLVPKAAMDIFKPIEWPQAQEIRATYAEGKDYFLFSGGFNAGKNLLAVLKGFSQFKKWQQSNMKLLIVGDTANDSAGLRQKLETFKFREDVIVLNKVDPGRLHLLMAAAYAFIYPSVEEAYGIPVLEALQSGTAVITSNAIQVEIEKGAVLFVDANDETEIGNQMIRLYKDEEFRKQLIGSGIAAAAKFNWKDAAGTLWQLIGDAAAKVQTSSPGKGGIAHQYEQR